MTSKPAPVSKPAVQTADLPTSILGVKRTVTPAQGKAWLSKSQTDIVRAMIAARYLTERGKAKSVRGLAVEWGVSKSAVARYAVAGDIVWRIGSGASESQAVDALTLANTVAQGLGKVDGFLSDDLKGAALGKALPGALAKAREARVAKGDKKSGARPDKGKTVTRKMSDAERVVAALDLLNGVKDPMNAEAESFVSLLTRTLALAAESGLDADVISAALIDALGSDVIGAAVAA